MPVYQYSAMDSSGKERKGTKDADLSKTNASQGLLRLNRSVNQWLMVSQISHHENGRINKLGEKGCGNGL